MENKNSCCNNSCLEERKKGWILEIAIFDHCGQDNFDTTCINLKNNEIDEIILVVNKEEMEYVKAESRHLQQNITCV